MILILSDRFDKHAERVISHLNEKQSPFFRFDLDVESLKHTSVTFTGDSWYIKNKSGELLLDQVTCVWLRRPFVELTLEEYNDQSVDFKIWKNEWNKTLTGIYMYLNHVPWLNPLKEAYRAENKYLQSYIAKAIGFKTPEMIVSNRKRDLIEFAKKHEKVVLKMMSQEFYETSKGTFQGLYVNLVSVDQLEDFEENQENPIVLQKYIEKLYEVRYTVVGNKHFPCKIESQLSKVSNIDWRRYDITNTPHYEIDPIEGIKTKVSSLMEYFGIEYGALDFIVTPDNEWVFLEVNSLGQWLWIEDLTNMPISHEVADWLYSKSLINI